METGLRLTKKYLREINILVHPFRDCREIAIFFECRN